MRRFSIADTRQTLAGLAKTYGMASQMYAEAHPSEANYVALLGGDTFGIHDDDAWAGDAAVRPMTPLFALQSA